MLIKSTWTLVVLLIATATINAQLPASPSHRVLNQPWDASWIAVPGTDLNAYGVYHFRKKFVLEKKVDKFVINLSADNRYHLFVNGRSLLRGPARGDLKHWQFETVDIAQYLNAGENVLAVQVWNFAENRAWAQITHQTGLVVQGNSDIEKIVNTDTTWKAFENEAYTPIASIAHITGPGDQLFCQRFPWKWETNDFNDSEWSQAIVSEPAFPKAAAKANTARHLVPRNIPFLEETTEKEPAIRKVEGLDQLINLPSQTSPLTVGPWQKVKILLDQGYLTTAFPEMKFSGGRGARIELKYAESLVDKTTMQKGDRDEIENKSMPDGCDKDVILLDGGASRNFSPLSYRTYRYLELTVENHQEELTIDSFHASFTAYPFREVASFSSDKKNLHDVWRTGWRTARLCANETYMDCPYYEQLQYVGDTRIQALISLYVSGDARLVKNAVEQFHNSFSNELTRSRYPDHLGQIIPPFSLFWIGMIHDYWMLRDDPEFIKRFLPAVKQILQWHERQIDPQLNMLGKMPHWNFVDWPNEWPWTGEERTSGIPPGALDGGSSILTLQYADALANAARIFDVYGNKADGVWARGVRAKIIEGTKTKCWDADRLLLADTPDKKKFSQHANLWAVLCDLVPQTKHKDLVTKILSDTSLTQCTFYYRFYLHKAVVKAGLGDRYVDLLAPWFQMLDMGLTTFAERPEPTRSDCHAWSASPNYDLLAIVCGIQSDSPGFKTVIVNPHLGPLQWVRGEMPHPKGTITVSLRRVGAALEGEISLPAQLTGNFIFDGKKITLRPGITKINARD